MTRPEAQAVIHGLAVGLDAKDADAAAARLLERVAARDDAAELRSALVELGVRAVLDVAAQEGSAWIS